jgi:hypothetical protein
LVLSVEVTKRKVAKRSLGRGLRVFEHTLFKIEEFPRCCEKPEAGAFADHNAGLNGLTETRERTGLDFDDVVVGHENLLLPETAGFLRASNRGETLIRSVPRQTTHADRSRGVATEDVASGCQTVHPIIERHRLVSLQGAHEDDSWRFSVGVAAQAAPSNPAISA